MFPGGAAERREGCGAVQNARFSPAPRLPPRPAPVLNSRMPPPLPDAPPQNVVVDVLAPVAVDTAYSYRAPAGWLLQPGTCVGVPLGTRQATGVVWAVRPGGGDNLKAVAAIRDWPPLRQPLRDFIDWTARWTLTPRGMRATHGDPRGRDRRAAARRNSASFRPASRPRA